jgi:hypothetical protein
VELLEAPEPEAFLPGTPELEVLFPRLEVLHYYSSSIFVRRDEF